MHETSKAVQRRLHDSNFISRYFRGNGIDIGAGNDPLGQYIELFPLMESCLSYDKEDGDAETMLGCKDQQYDFVHSSHCLEDLDNPYLALKNWFRLLKPGGHLIVTVPDEDMYEQGVWPSTFNADHRWSFTISKRSSWSERSRNVLHLIGDLGETADILKIERLTGTYRFNLVRQDQTRTPIGEAAIEFVVRKRGNGGKPIGRVSLIVPSHINHVDTSKQSVLSSRPKIALHRPGAIGDIIMTLSLILLLKRKYPEHEIHYFCVPSIGKGLHNLMTAAGVDKILDTKNRPPTDPTYDKYFNLIGYPLQEGYPYKPMAKHLIEYFADEMGVELPRSHLADTSPTIPHLTLEPDAILTGLPPKYVTIHPQAGWSAYKNWKPERWEKVIAARPDLWFYQIGAETDHKLLGANHSLMGKPLDVSIALMAQAAMHVGVDSWTNHLTNIFWKGRGFVPAVILWGSTQASAAGYPRNTNILLGLECQPCFREDPKISSMPLGPCINPPGQDYERPRHACMEGIDVDLVLNAIGGILPGD
jgi:ADP-heptose:LPS heptosyltransferase